MNPEDYLMVQFLRFLKFHEAADQYVRFLLNECQISIHPDIVMALDLIDKRMKVHFSPFFKASTDMHPKRDIIFQRVAEQFNLSELTNVFTEIQMRHMNLYH